MPPKRKREASHVEKRPRFGRLPERGVSDKRLWRTRHGMHARVLFACAIHADVQGLFCVSQETVAGLVGLKHGANAHSYMRDLEDWGYLQRVKSLPHPDRKFIKEAARAMGRSDIRPPYLSNLIVRRLIIRPGEDQAENAAKIPASKRIDEDHPIDLPELDPPEPLSPRRPMYEQKPVIAVKVGGPPKSRPRPPMGGCNALDFDVF